MASALDAVPKIGDYTICIECGHIGVFDMIDGKLTTRNPTSEEIVTMAGNPQLPHMQKIRHMAWMDTQKKKAGR